ncbi:MAG: hypothetical protein JSR48_05440 [Verrucomicrobia bacterium]|nr:hypothetical protein [Verrucomicrobiota bacterium]
MGIEFGWWNKDDEGRKFQVSAIVHGGNIEWTMHQGHHTSWQPYSPNDDDRERLLYEAEKRLPRRLITQKQFDEIKRLSANEGPGRITGKRLTGRGPSLYKYDSTPGPG